MTDHSNNLPEKPAEPQTSSKSLSQAWIAHVKGDHAMAEIEFNKVLEADPNSVDALYGYGLTQKLLGNNETAIVYFQKALDILTKEDIDKKIGRGPMLRSMTQAQLSLLGGNSQ
jgi:tetratricopeptide (TPR) repeat protein